jgi:hypothetical protein
MQMVALKREPSTLELLAALGASLNLGLLPGEAMHCVFPARQSKAKGHPA